MTSLRSLRGRSRPEGRSAPGRSRERTHERPSRVDDHMHCDDGMLMKTLVIVVEIHRPNQTHHHHRHHHHLLLHERDSIMS